MSYSILSKKIGQQMEHYACQYLCQAGLQLVQKNYYYRGGEIDLIMLDQQTLCFTEVRYRRTFDYGGPIASITATKQKRIIHTAEAFLQAHQPHYHDCRFDVVALSGKTMPYQIEWIKSAFFPTF